MRSGIPWDTFGYQKLFAIRKKSVAKKYKHGEIACQNILLVSAGGEYLALGEAY